jgi:hypothetical protein
MRRYSTARAPIQESNTARIAWSSCSCGSWGKSSSVTSLEGLEVIDEAPEVVGGELGVVLHARLGLALLDRGLDLLPGHPAADVPEHLHEAAVGVPGEALVLGLPGEALDGLVVQAEVQDRVHHAWHRLPRAAADTDEQRVVGVAQLLAGGFLEVLQRLGDLRLELLRLGAVGLHVGDAGLGRDREAGRDPLGAEYAGHLRDVGALAPEQVAHVPRSLGELVDVLGGGAGASHEPEDSTWRCGVVTFVTLP